MNNTIRIEATSPDGIVTHMQEVNGYAEMQRTVESWQYGLPKHCVDMYAHILHVPAKIPKLQRSYADEMNAQDSLETE